MEEALPSGLDSVTKDLQLGDLNQQEFIQAQVWKPEF